MIFYIVGLFQTRDIVPVTATATSTTTVFDVSTSFPFVCTSHVKAPIDVTSGLWRNLAIQTETTSREWPNFWRALEVIPFYRHARGLKLRHRRGGIE